MGTNDESSQVRAIVRAQRLAEAAQVARVERGREGWAGQSAAIYCRISHVRDEDQTGVDRQERICRDIAERHNLFVAQELVFVDNNRSAWSRARKRAGWDQMLSAAARGQVRHVIAYHPDRLMRQPRDLEELLKISDDHGITLHGEANHRDLSNADDRFMLRIEVAHACRSSDDASRRLRAAMVDRARDGKPHLSRRRFGYESDGVTIREAEAEIVREVFSRFLDGASMAQIGSDLAARDILTSTGFPWNAQRVRNLLDAAHVAGLQIFRGEVIGHGEWPGIISEEIFAETRERRAYRAAAHNAGSSEWQHRFYRLRGLVICTNCGTPMSGAGGQYICNKKVKAGPERCVRTAVAAPVERFVTDATIQYLSQITVSGAEQTGISQADEDAIEAERGELSDLKAMWDAHDLPTREYWAMRRTVEERIKRIEARGHAQPAATVLAGLTGPRAAAAWQKLEDAGDLERINAIFRFLYAAVLIGEGKRGGHFNYGRVTLEPHERR